MWLHTARGCSHQSFACPMQLQLALMFSGSAWYPNLRPWSQGSMKAQISLRLFQTAIEKRVTKGTYSLRSDVGEQMILAWMHECLTSHIQSYIRVMSVDVVEWWRWILERIELTLEYGGNWPHVHGTTGAVLTNDHLHEEDRKPNEHDHDGIRDQEGAWRSTQNHKCNVM